MLGASIAGDPLLELFAVRAHDESARFADPIDGRPNGVPQRLVLPLHVKQGNGGERRFVRGMSIFARGSIHG